MLIFVIICSFTLFCFYILRLTFTYIVLFQVITPKIYLLIWVFWHFSFPQFVIIPGDNDIGGEPPDFRSPFKMNRFEKNFENLTGAFSYGFLDFLKVWIILKFYIKNSHRHYFWENTEKGANDKLELITTILDKQNSVYKYE